MTGIANGRAALEDGDICHTKGGLAADDLAMTNLGLNVDKPDSVAVLVTQMGEIAPIIPIGHQVRSALSQISVENRY